LQRKYQTIVIAITAILMMLEHFIKNPVTAMAAKEVRNWGILIGAFALGIGSVNLLSIHGKRISEKRSGWTYSVVFLIGLITFAGIGVLKGTSDPTLTMLFNVVMAPMSTTMFGTLIFCIVSAGYRSFVVRKAESAVILTTALIVMLAQIPIGKMISPVIPQISTWLQDIPNNAGQRGIMIGAAIGAVANGLRVLLGLERNFGG